MSYSNSAVSEDMAHFTKDSLDGGPPRYQISQIKANQTESNLQQAARRHLRSVFGHSTVEKKDTHCGGALADDGEKQGLELSPQSASCRIQQQGIAAPSAFWIHSK